jgi:uncharacterized membrane protein YidH (DUF202 family)
MSSIDPRTALAGERTRMAAFRTQKALDRTTLAWIRTTLTMATFGFGLAGFFRSLAAQSPSPETIRLHQYAVQFGGVLLLLGTIATALAGWTHWRTLRRLQRGEPLELVRWPLSITLAYLLTLLFAVGLWTLFVR